jgi:hypothetical protein
MFDEARARVREATLRLAGLDASTINRVALAELRRDLDSLEAEYGRLAAGVDVSWMAQATGSTVRRAQDHAAVGAALQVSPVLAEAVRAGEVALENVAVLSAVAGHPMFEASSLVGAAAVLTPPKLRAAVDQWRAVVDRAADETYERSCHRRRSLKFSTNLDGMVRVDGLFAAETGRVLRHALDNLVRIHRLDETGRTPEQRRADALVELAAAYNAGTVTGGRERPQILVTINVEQLAGRAGGRALLDTGETITIDAARRLACDADIATVLLKGGSEILDFGRTHRVASAAQYKALVIRDGGCRFPGWDRPPGWTQAHHIVQWPDGGRTDLDNLVLFMPHRPSLDSPSTLVNPRRRTSKSTHPTTDPRAPRPPGSVALPLGRALLGEGLQTFLQIL